MRLTVWRRAEDRHLPGKQPPGRGATRVRAGSLFWSLGSRLKDSKNQRSNPTTLSYPRLVWPRSLLSDLHCAEVQSLFSIDLEAPMSRVH